VDKRQKLEPFPRAEGRTNLKPGKRYRWMSTTVVI